MKSKNSIIKRINRPEPDERLDVAMQHKYTLDPSNEFDVEMGAHRYAIELQNLSADRIKDAKD